MAQQESTPSRTSCGFSDIALAVSWPIGSSMRKPIGIVSTTSRASTCALCTSCISRRQKYLYGVWPGIWPGYLPRQRYHSQIQTWIVKKNATSDSGSCRQNWHITHGGYWKTRDLRGTNRTIGTIMSTSFMNAVFVLTEECWIVKNCRTS